MFIYIVDIVDVFFKKSN